jgi:hypothetical protein
VVVVAAVVLDDLVGLFCLAKNESRRDESRQGEIPTLVKGRYGGREVRK